MKIRFITKKQDLNRGSYRIWIHNLSKTLNLLGADTDICNYSEFTLNDNSNIDCLIYDKGLIPPSKSFTCAMRERKKIIIGAINPPQNKKYDVDFVIVGSKEEENSLSFYNTIIHVPLIETHIKNSKRKHYQKQSLTLCYHGNEDHLNTFKSNGLMKALELFYEEKKN